MIDRPRKEPVTSPPPLVNPTFTRLACSPILNPQVKDPDHLAMFSNGNPRSYATILDYYGPYSTTENHTPFKKVMEVEADFFRI